MRVNLPASKPSREKLGHVDREVNDDGNLVLRIGARDEAALVMMMERYSRPVYSAAFRVLRERSDAQEVTQDVFHALWRRPERFDAERGKLGTWLIILSRSRALDLLRNREHASELSILGVETLNTGFNTVMNPCEAKVLLGQLTDGLPDEQAWAIRKVYLEGYTASEAAALRQTPEGTMKSRARLALEKMRTAAHPDSQPR